MFILIYNYCNREFPFNATVCVCSKPVGICEYENPSMRPDLLPYVFWA